MKIRIDLTDKQAEALHTLLTTVLNDPTFPLPPAELAALDNASAVISRALQDV
jgi:hypothetical protein